MDYPNEQTNIVLIMNDHQAYYRHGWDGGVKPKRPYFDKLAEQGVEFTKSYCATPLCGPVRRSFINGLFPHNHGHYYNDSKVSYDNEESYLKILKENNYDVYYYGKWHAGPGTAISEHGCEGFSCEAYGNPYITKEYKEYLEKRNLPEARHFIEHNFTPERFAEEGFFVDICENIEYQCKSTWCGEHASGITVTPEDTHESFFLANLACEKLEEIASSKNKKPFHLRVDFWGPHQPFFPTQKYADMYNPDDIQIYGNFYDTLENKPEVHMLDDNRLISKDNKMIVPSPLEWKEWQKVLARAYAHQTMIDAAGGRILDKLKELGLDKNTLIIWTTDHGDGLASHGGHFDKSSYMTEEVMRIPMAISYPEKINPNTKNDRLVSNLDLPTTILASAGLSFKNKTDSRNLFDAIDMNKSWPDDLFCETFGHGYKERIRGRMYVNGDFKYVKFEGQMKELYNLAEDPYEMNNLALDEGYADMIQKMEDGLQKLQSENGDTHVF